MEPLNIKSGQGDYSVEFMATPEELVREIVELPKAVVLVDRNVAELYADALATVEPTHPTLSVDPTEDEKTLSGVTRALSFLQSSNSTRETVVVAIGGGITQDIATVAAHLYYRGLKLMLVPTTLLAMTDSCIGAKCGINFGPFKNQLGVFHSPWRVLQYAPFLETISDVDVQSGYGEILKLLLTGSKDAFLRLQTAVGRGGFRNPELPTLIRESLDVKKLVIEEDEYEKDLRRILNYGHTFGHALEAVTDHEVPHGVAVAWGLDLVNHLARGRGLLNEADCQAVHEFAREHFSCPVSRPLSAEELIRATRRDKKVAGGKLVLIMMERPGSLKIVPVAFDDELESAVSEYLEIGRVVYWD